MPNELRSIWIYFCVFCLRTCYEDCTFHPPNIDSVSRYCNTSYKISGRYYWHTLDNILPTKCLDSTLDCIPDRTFHPPNIDSFKSLQYFLQHLWTVLLLTIFCLQNLWTVLLTVPLAVHSIHQIFTVYQDIAILPTKSLDCTVDHTLGHIVANDLIRNCIKIPQNFLPYYQLYCHIYKACILYFAVL